MTKLALLSGGMVGVALLVQGFITLERRGRRETAVIIIAGLVVLEALLYSSQGNVGSVLFYPKVGGQQFRLPEILIPLALFARWRVTRHVRSISGTDLAWGVFFTWYLAEFVMGYLGGNPTKTALFDAKAIVYVGGAYYLAAGMSPAKLLRRMDGRRWWPVFATVVAIFDIGAFLNITFSTHVPLVRLDLFSYAADASACVAAVAIVVLMVELARPRPRPGVAIVALLLALSPFTGSQRASIVDAVAQMVVVVAVAIGPTWRRRIKIAGSGVVAGLGLLLATAGAGVALIPGLGAGRVTAKLTNTFYSVGKQQSANARHYLWHQAHLLINQRLIFGWGLGKEPLLRQIPPLPPIVTPTHNLALDILLRAGVVGLILFAIALTCSLAQAAYAWRRHPDARVAALALGAAAAVVGLLAKGAVESVFDQFRIATMLGLALGTIAACANASTRALPVPAEPSETALPG